ncbi:GGDEF domain-containing protein [Acetobacteraceae bacterium KSS8]|uniref:diguanylate cyclase n=1 Tax=Endosaccharibacter trunci TaxID=2812733 RepID=A0ABT1W9Y8_9PROT|nr:GGDEF domain-containing protein [Acetobacteraceae bacterium KSS8]
MSSNLIAAIEPKIVMSLICTLNVVPCWLLRRDMRDKSVRLLNEATLAFGVGLPLLLFKDWLPRTPVVIVGNMLILAAMTLLWQSVAALSGQKTDRRLVAVAPSIWLVCWLLPMFRAERDLRIAFVCSVAGLLIFRAVIDLLRGGRGTAPERLLVATGLFHVMIGIVRVVLAVRHAPFAQSPLYKMLTELNTLTYMMLWPTLCTILLHRRLIDAEAARGRRDELSGLLNRRGLLFQIDRIGPGTLILFDIDHFKRINDQHGHASGDKAIVAFAVLAERVLGPELLLGRIGGEEFLAFLPAGAATTAQNAITAVNAAERVREAFAATPLIGSRATTVSVGVASPLAGEALDIQLARADRALYRAKRRGRNRVELCDGAGLADPAGGLDDEPRESAVPAVESAASVLVAA